jgi:uncharacterized iron-regulated membrane protein
MIRGVFVWLHRWVGLLMTVFLIIVGLTGSLLAFNNELEHVFAPRLFAQVRPGVPPLALATLAERAETLVPHAHVVGVTMSAPDQAAISFRAEIDPATERRYDLGFTQFFVDPWTGAELGRRTRGDLSEGLVNFMPFIYLLHDALMLKRTGATILGVVAVLWTIDCFVGFYLTLPVSLPGFWRRWMTAWRVKRGAGFYRVNFDLHRASGLWLWPALLIFAWSSVMFNMNPVYEWVMTKFFETHSARDEISETERRQSKPYPILDWRAAQAVGERLMAEQALKSSFTIEDTPGLGYLETSGLYVYSVRSSRDVIERSIRGGSTRVTFDGDTGELVQFSAPTGTYASDAINRWLIALHTARVFGLPYRIFVCALGMVITMLSATGAYIWWKKRSAWRFHKTRGASVGVRLGSSAPER